MPYEMKWLVERRVITSRINGETSAEDIADFVEMFNARLENGNPPVHHVVEISGIGKAVVNLREVNQVVSFDKSRHGWVVVVSREMNPFVRFVISVVLEARHLPVHICQNFDEARAFLLEVDPSLQGQLNQLLPQ